MSLREQVEAILTDQNRERALRALAICERCQRYKYCNPPSGWFLLSHFPCGVMMEKLQENR